MGTQTVGLLLSAVRQIIRHTFIEASNTKYHEHPFSGSRLITCGRTDMASQTGTFVAVCVCNASEPVPMVTAEPSHSLQMFCKRNYTAPWPRRRPLTV